MKSAHRRVAVAALAATFVVSGCAKSEEEPATTGAGAAPAASQVVQSAAPGAATCTIDQHGGEKIDLKTAKVGFSQSEKEANPFRIAETQSIKDEAAKLGITQLTTANANSQFNKQISDVEQMIDAGVQLLIIAPLNSDGWDSVFAKASAKKIPIVTIDRKINAAACKDYLTFIGSDFAEQGKRAADEMAKALGNKGEVAILLGAPGNNVTTLRTSGFKDQMAKVAPDIKITFEQTGNFSREEGQKVAEQLLQSKPNINGIYGENDEMALGAVTALKGAGKKPGDVKIVSIDGTKGAVQGIVDGWISAVVESNPRFGPLAFSTAGDFFTGKPVGQDIIIADRSYDESNAKADLASAY
ncbi:ribose transport system substrate-binding protein [Actinoplanes campanulatus]|uniref:Ribose transport system substrate-binding protein n=1 Tax=Actinoplanes campanulatus TaxID=113559 RepID=A0A7W5AR36_9ACTN|nr:ABC transporter substrate-binding protein [Actinoplanes campanulatus]MBB3100843.1 ribose transport system substrate-binding protein [Actinoplanes campanulatus]GGN46340.1 LacI family transcriptional regulator [Actinoplanes campanulatus]GID41245.1 LacI family transcriptional regulator [Actinoplanes campanulatus]